MTAPAGRTALFPIGPTAPYQFAPGSPERAATAAALAEVRTASYDVAEPDRLRRCAPAGRRRSSRPHDHSHPLGQVHYGGGAGAAAIDAALAASRWWSRLPWEERAAPFLRAADMLRVRAVA